MLFCFSGMVTWFLSLIWEKFWVRYAASQVSSCWLFQYPSYRKEAQKSEKKNNNNKAATTMARMTVTLNNKLFREAPATSNSLAVLWGQSQSFMGHRSRLYLVLCQIYRNIIEEAKILPKNSSKAIIAKDPCFSVYNTKW